MNGRKSLISKLVASNGILSHDQVRQALATALQGEFTGQRVLTLIPDHTRSIPLPFLFRELVTLLYDTKQLDFMVALGTHPPLSETRLCGLVSITQKERRTIFSHINLLNHEWDSPTALTQIGKLTQSQIKQIAGPYWHPSLGGDVALNINKRFLKYDHILILGPTFPHEVAGYSGGAKYFFPGISGPEMINVTHWLGALSGVRGTIGRKETPVRAMIHAAAEYIHRPTTLISLVVVSDGLAGLFIGDYLAAWEASADLSSERHIIRLDKQYCRILSCAPPMYDELWTAGKAMYKLEPVLAEGGELIIYAPHLEVISRTHGKYLSEVGYHVLPYFLNQWEIFGSYPLGVLAHSTHIRGDGSFEDGIEVPRAKVTLATKISPQDCAHLGLGYHDPGKINLNDWLNREDEGILYVPKAGEMLYRR